MDDNVGLHDGEAALNGTGTTYPALVVILIALQRLGRVLVPPLLLWYSLETEEKGNHRSQRFCYMVALPCLCGFATSEDPAKLTKCVKTKLQGYHLVTSPDATVKCYLPPPRTLHSHPRSNQLHHAHLPSHRTSLNPRHRQQLSHQ
jgi:hypothetical protein